MPRAAEGAGDAREGTLPATEGAGEAHLGGGSRRVPGTPRPLLSSSSIVELELAFPSPYITAGGVRLRLLVSPDLHYSPRWTELGAAVSGEESKQRATPPSWRRQRRWSSGRLGMWRRKRWPTWFYRFRYMAEFVQFARHGGGRDVSQGGCPLPAQGTRSGRRRCSLLLTSLSDPVPLLHLLAYSLDIPCVSMQISARVRPSKQIA